jgi:hypothetical protein
MSNQTGTPPKLSAYTEEQFADLASWPDGWNGEGSLAPNARALDHMRSAINASANRDADYELYANENGTVTLEQYTTRGWLMIEVGINTYAHLHIINDGPAEMWNGPISDLLERGIQSE